MTLEFDRSLCRKLGLAAAALFCLPACESGGGDAGGGGGAGGNGGERRDAGPTTDAAAGGQIGPGGSGGAGGALPGGSGGSGGAMPGGSGGALPGGSGGSGGAMPGGIEPPPPQCDDEHACPPNAVCRDGECVLVEGDLCDLPPDSGPCAAAFERWSFDAASGACQAFVWGGCGGNENNFETREACEARCGAPPPPPACVQDLDCPAPPRPGCVGRCVGGMCSVECAPACGPDAPCPDGEACEGGVCVPAVMCPDPNDPSVHYVSQDPEQCRLVRFACAMGQTMFSDPVCGCGCIDDVRPACAPGELRTPDGLCVPACNGNEECPAGTICNAGEVCLPDPDCPMCAVCAGWCVVAVMR